MEQGKIVQIGNNCCLSVVVKVKVKQSVTSLECPRGFQEVKLPRFHDDGTGWW
jgi:hypothetical protein